MYKFRNLGKVLYAPEGGAGGSGGTEPPAAGTQTQNQQPTAPSFDYDKLAGIISGAQTAKEDSVLKNYFKQQGLTGEEMTQAINTFKAEKAKNTPDPNALQSQLAQAQATAQQAQIENAATLQAIQLGIDAKTIPYVLKMADLGQVVGEDGKVNEETLKNALNKVLEDIPALKPQTAGTSGFMQVGAGGGNAQGKAGEDELKKAFGL